VQRLQPQHQRRGGVGFVVVPGLPAEERGPLHQQLHQVGGGGLGIDGGGGQAELRAGGLREQAGRGARRQVAGVGADHRDRFEQAAARGGQRGQHDGAGDAGVDEAGRLERQVEPAPPFAEAVFFSVVGEVVAQGVEVFEHAGAGGVGFQRGDGVELGEAVGQPREPRRERGAGLGEALAGIEQCCQPGRQRAELRVRQPSHVGRPLRDALPPQRELELQHRVLARCKLAQHERRLQQVEQFDVGKVARHAFEPAVDHRGGGGGRQRPAGLVGHQHVHALEQRAHPPRGFAVERDQRDLAPAGAQLFGHPAGNGARFGFQMRRRAEFDARQQRRGRDGLRQPGGAIAQRRFGQLPGLVQGECHAVGRIGGRLEQRDRRVFGAAFEKLLFDRGQGPQRVAINRFGQRSPPPPFWGRAVAALPRSARAGGRARAHSAPAGHGRRC
jgi:hypothetical protein